MENIDIMVELDVFRGEFSDSLSFTSKSIEFRPPGQITYACKMAGKIGKNLRCRI